MRPTTRLASALALALAACSSGGGSGGMIDPMTAAPDMSVMPPDLAMVPYPAGPYGVKEGDTLSDFSAKGYPLSRAQTDSTSFMGQLSDIKISSLFFNPACKCILISIGAEWCGPCNQEQPVVVDGVMNDPSLCVYSVLVEGPSRGASAKQADLDDWTQRYSQNFPVVLPATAALIHLPKATGLPTNVVVDPSNMQILRIEMGFNSMQVYTAKAVCGL